ncbi:hypothetical protein D3C79_872580 [compost metagenome]
MSLTCCLGQEAPGRFSRTADDPGIFWMAVDLRTQAAQDARSGVLQQPAIAGTGVAGQGQGEGLIHLQADRALARFFQHHVVVFARGL